MDENNKIFYISFLSVIATFMVVLCHANEFYILQNNPNWFTCNLIECLSNFAVPCFFMITGVTLLDYNKKYSLKRYFQKRIMKTFVPFIFWSLVGLVWLVLIKKISIQLVDFMYIVKGILNYSFVPIYWFFIELFRVYLLIPIFANIKDENKMQIYTYLVLCIFILDSFLPFIQSQYSISLYFKSELVPKYLIYVLLGYILSKSEKIHKYRKIIYILSLISILTIIIGTYILSMAHGSIQDVYRGYTNVPCLFYSVGVFLFIKNFIQDTKFSKRFEKSVYMISGYTFSIYLLHIFIIDTLKFYIPFEIHANKYYILAITVITIPICIMLTFLIRKIPIVKYVLPK